MSAFPENVFKYCPRCGSNFPAVRSDLFVCEDCDFHFFINACSASAAIITDELGRILLTTREKEPAAGMLDLPGGFINIGENAEDGVRRELKEELNIEVIDLKYFCSGTNEYTYRELTYSTLDLIYTCKIKDRTKLQVMEEIESFAFYKPEEIDLEKIAFKSLRDAVRTFIQK